jgi:hypothetical protein
VSFSSSGDAPRLLLNVPRDGDFILAPHPAPTRLDRKIDGFHAFFVNLSDTKGLSVEFTVREAIAL